MDKAVTNYLYFHIGNGGVTFKVTNEVGPTIDVSASHFGNVTNSMKLHVNKEGLKALGEMFIKASEQEFNEPYCCFAKVNEYDSKTNQMIGNKSVNVESTDFESK
ncbi:hypothetical protein D3C81_610100 [compost metagenome]